VCLFFYPRDFTFVCPTEMKAFGRAEAEFDMAGCVILGCSTDSEWSHKAWIERDLPEVRYPVLADTNHAISRAYQVLNASGASERGLFLIDPQGVLRYALVSPGSVGRSVKETLRVLKAVQSGQLCPVEWNPGEATLGSAS
jgi:alkyl hydroperoxide reductase subunit AhpC